MSGRPKFSAEEFTAAPKVPVSLGLEREDRVALIGACAKALLAGKLPDAPARLFVGGALVSWLEGGGDLARDYLRVVKPKSRRTASAIWRELHHRDEDGHANEREAGEDGE